MGRAFVALLEALHEGCLEKELGQHIAVAHARGAFAVELDEVQGAAAVGVTNEKAVKPRRRNAGVVAGGQPDKFFFVRRQRHLRAQPGVAHHPVRRLAENAQQERRACVQPGIVGLGLQHGPQHSAERAVAKIEQPLAHSRFEHAPGILRECAGGTKFVIEVDGGVNCLIVLGHGVGRCVSRKAPACLRRRRRSAARRCWVLWERMGVPASAFCG